MQKIIKRLELIKSAISLEDNDIVLAQIAHLQSLPELPSLPALEEILRLLDTLNYATAVQCITQFITDQTQVAFYEDPELSALKMELHGLEQQLAQINSQREETVHLIAGFNALYSERLGSEISKILIYRLKITNFLLKRLESAEQTDEAERAEAEVQYNEAEADYEYFQKDYQAQQQKVRAKTLSKEEQKALKTTFRRASKLCHPDMVAEELKDKATEQFTILYDAYEQNDLEKVEEILIILQAGGFATASEQVNDKDKLREYIRTIRTRIIELQTEVAILENDETYQLIKELDSNYEPFFKSRAEQLEEELQALRAEFEGLQTS